MAWQWLKGKLRISLLEVVVTVLIIAVLAILIDFAVVGAGHGYRAYLFVGTVRDARTGQPIAGAELSLTMRHRLSRDPSRVVSREPNWPHGLTSQRDGSFRGLCDQVYGVWQRGCRSGVDLPVHECTIVALHEGYVAAAINITPPPEPNDGRIYLTSGILIELEPKPDMPRPSGADLD